MFRPLRTLFVLVVCASFAPAALADDVYKWTDSNGTTHYADAPPEGREYEKLSISRGASRVAVDPEQTDSDAAAAGDAGGTSAAVAAAAASPSCVQARANLETLRNNPVVRKDTDGDGVPEDISGVKLQEEIARAQKLVDVYCN